MSTVLEPVAPVRTAANPIQEMDETGKVLDQAADYIEKHGWAKYHIKLPRGEVCVIGAIAAVSDGIFGRKCNEARTLLEGVVGYAPGWNDRPESTKEEVVNKLREVARMKR